MADISLDLDPASPTYLDLLVQDGDLVMNSGTTAIQQHILQRLRVFAGEWFLDNTIGIPFFQEFFVKNPDQSKVDAILQSVISQTPGVQALTRYNFSVDTASRQIKVSFSAQTTTGTVNYNGLVDF